MKAYAGIGSRSTPADMLTTIQIIASRLAEEGWTLRSGGADGADTAFENGAFPDGRTRHPNGTERVEVYLPWALFNGRERLVRLREPQPEAFEITRRFHPTWDRCSGAAQRLHARNVHQILGPDVTAPVLSRFVICWTKDGLGGGGTGQALRIAQHYDVPIFDLAKPGTIERIQKGLFT